MSWWWRTKPRSIIRTIQWFNEFGKLEGKKWNYRDPCCVSKKDGSAVHPVRREYIYAAHSEENSNIGSLTINKYLSGKYDVRETESDGRNDKTTFEFFGFGYVNEDGIIKVNDVGKRILSGTFDSEDFLKQLLKLQFPNPLSRGNGFLPNEYIYPLELICKAFEKFDSLNRSEFVLLFGCNSLDKLDLVLNGIDKFKKEYAVLPNKNNQQDVKALCKRIYIEIYGGIDNKIDSYYDYAEALCRCLIYTGLFKASGRSLATKIRVPEYSKIKFNLLLKSFEFTKKEFSSVEEYMDWFGSTSNILLPWNNSQARRDIINEKLDYIERFETNQNFINKYKEKSVSIVKDIVSNTKQLLKNKDLTYEALKDKETELTSFITNVKEQQFVDVYSKTKEAKDEILSMYDQILDQIDDGALWLEVNTWKSLIAVNGKKQVKRNFNIEEDLSPKSFAPGIGNTPDMELYTKTRVLIPEVSLMTGTQQWEHEASSVIDHVLSFIDDNQGKQVRGLFISKSLNIRTKWQFFILNKESWVGKPVPVIPLTIEQYKEIISVIYANNLSIDDFLDVVEEIHKIAKKSSNYDEWMNRTALYLKQWGNHYTVSA
ncbi:MAG: AlwI family type II restriction endonuclease [Clostridium sp.]|nr:AlwI family type II restriction endonuclease [Clostridium sp.]